MRLLIKIALIVLITSVFVACAHQKGTTKNVANKKEGTSVAFTLENQNGAKVSLTDYKNKVVLLSFWATWCQPCKEEIPILADIYERYKDKPFTVLFINVDTPDKTADARAYVASLPEGLVYLFDPDFRETGFLNPSRDLPFMVLLTKEHKVYWEHSGFSVGDETEIEEQIKNLLAE